MRLPQTGQALIPGAIPRDRGDAIRVLRLAVELGVNHIDTAAFYFSPTRSANELINRALAPYPDDLVIGTKVGPMRDPSGGWIPHATPGQLRGLVEENLRQLGRDHLDLVNLRISGSGSVSERFGALAELREQGLIRHLGLSNVQLAQLNEAQAIAPVVCVQNMYGLGVRSDQDDFLGVCGERGVAFVPFFAIAAHGRESGAAGGDHPDVWAVAARHGASPAQVRIAWTLRQGPHVLAIPGTGDRAHLRANVAAGAIALSDEELRALDALHRSAPPWSAGGSASKE
jgi:aryl-alcohol dehydrogenase-like predicted oxidoreductase